MSASSQFDDILTQLGTGKWNLIVILGVAYWACQIPYHTMGGAFLTPQMDHTCQLPEGALPLLTNDTNTTQASACAYLVEREDGSVEERPCTRWHFDNSTYDSTLTSEFQLVCNFQYLRPTYSSMYYFGAFFASPLNGWLADRYGRKTMMTIGGITYTILGNCLSWLPNISAVLVLRFFMGLMHPTSIQTGYTLAMEITEPRMRAVVGIVTFLPWALGVMWWGCLAYLIRDWRWLMFTASLPAFVYLPMLWFMDESPRWLIVHGHHDRALKVLQRAARLNKAKLPPEDQLRVLMKDIAREHAQYAGHRKEGFRYYLQTIAGEFTVLVRTKRMRARTLSIYTIFLTSGLVYLGLSLGGDNFSSNPFVYMVLSGVMELPGSTITVPMVERFGRQTSNIMCFLATGVALLGLTIAPSGLGWLVMTLALVGKLSISAAYQIVYLHATELFPTEVRTRGLGTSSMVAKVGSILAPYLMDTLRTLWVSAPSVVCGVAGLVAAGVTYTLPETRGTALPDTVASLEASSPVFSNRKASSVSQKPEDCVIIEEKSPLAA